jgi:tetratricopeptide (TPR) repeat protein
MALLATENDDQHEALRHVTSALDLYEQLDDTDGTARTLNAAGWITGRLGDHRQALVFCERALALLEPTPHYPEYAYTLDSIGHQHEQLGDLDAAIAYYQRAHAALDTASDRMTRAEIVRHLDEATTARG